MSKPRFTTQQMAAAGIIAAIYAALTLLLPIPQYGGIQFRVAEAMTVLPFLFPEAIPGLTVGCFLANLLGSPIPLDWIVGTAATLLAALWTSKLHHRALAPLPPVICCFRSSTPTIMWRRSVFTIAESCLSILWARIMNRLLTGKPSTRYRNA